MTWSAPTPIPGSPERYITHPRGVVLRVRNGLYLAFRGRTGRQEMAQYVGRFTSAKAAQAAITAENHDEPGR